MTMKMIKSSNKKNKVISTIGNLKNSSDQKVGSQSAPNLNRLSGEAIGGDVGRQKLVLTSRLNKNKGPSGWTNSLSPTAGKDKNQNEEDEGCLGKKDGHGNDIKFTESQQQQEQMETKYQPLKESKRTDMTEQKKDGTHNVELLHVFVCYKRHRQHPSGRHSFHYIMFVVLS